MILSGSLTDTNVEDVYEELLMDCEHKKVELLSNLLTLMSNFKYLCMAKCLH